MNKLTVLENNNERVLTTKQLAEVYETLENNIQQNFKRNSDRFIEGKHYYKLIGDELRNFKNNYMTDSQLVDKRAAQIILWTEKGASRMCKILDTDKAWEQFDILEETYFRVKSQSKKQLPNDYLTALKALVASEEEKQQLKLENDYKQEVIQGLTEEISISDMRSILNRVVRKGGKYQERYSALYQAYKDAYHIDLKIRFKNYNDKNSPKYKSVLEYADKKLGAIKELYKIACKLFESDVDKLVNEMYNLR